MQNGIPSMNERRRLNANISLFYIEEVTNLCIPKLMLYAMEPIVHLQDV